MTQEKTFGSITTQNLLFSVMTVALRRLCAIELGSYLVSVHLQVYVVLDKLYSLSVKIVVLF